ncbi:non-ribosomal peptide synthetase [Azospirillum brasilense]|uniref:non-ribosomal peptide synthetase n=1 Tax=Azospirillum brasilense TaxID=192 RepID=UPI000E69A034|nr:non-ribosomal peptide synthetase [Azospirillum brasilense]NUB31752.1 amino acid adenylation domain-containing protein [Azospirillum brasilense]RIW06247.1 amino acid adenylation domain-containing protein [Azospirillum brasilense]
MPDTTPHLPNDRIHLSGSFGPLRIWPDLRLHEGFERLAERHPTAPAVVTEAGILDYAGLDTAANALAHALLALGLNKEEPVGVLAERSGDLPQAFLGILKAGGVYVPMVADLPPERLANMARQAGMRLLIALDGLTPPDALAGALSANGNTKRPQAVLRPESLDGDSLAKSAERPNRPGPANGLAVILFTSGSTGQPKGVLIQHDACVNLALGHTEAQGVGPGDRVLLSTSPGFILGFRELCLPLLSGAAYVPASRALIDDPARLLDHMARLGVTIALFTPSYLRLLRGAVPAGLRMILTAGERPNPDDARHYARHLDYWNMHGATEVCGTICMHKVNPDGDGPLPSGRPFTNNAVHLLDRHGNEVPDGVVGEIHVIGRGVSRGYLNQPELSAENFVGTRFGRAYRTHDLGRWNENGELETLGRADDMVKVSGQSVSLVEIERTLLRHPLVSRAAALQHQGRLTAIVESVDPEVAQSEDWRTFLGRSLPAYMVPAQVRAVARMPISSAGKTDRRALLALAEEALTAARSTGGTPPQGDLERAIAAVWEEVLDTRPVMRDDPFFAIGGTSLLAIAVGQRLHALGHAVTVPVILASQTVQALARRIAEQPDEDAAPPDLSEGPATAGQEDFWIAAKLGLAAAGSHVVRVLSVRGPVPQAERWRAAWAALLGRHPALRTAFHADAEGRVRWRTVPANALPPAAGFSIDRCHVPEEARELIAGYAETPFALTKAPLARAGLMLVESGNETLFWFVLHHAVVDGQSARTVQEDVLALLLGRPLPPAPHGIALAARDEARHLGSHRAEQDRAFWQAKLDALPLEAFEELPFDQPRPTTPGGRSAPPLAERLDAATTAALTAIAKAQGVGLHGLLLAILAAETRRRGGQTDLILGTGVSLRPAGSEDAVGHFVNLVPVVLPGATAALAAQVRAAQDALTEAVGHAGLPANLIQREFRQRRPDALPTARPNLFAVALTANPPRTSGDPASSLSLSPRRLPGALAHPAAGLDLAFSHEPVAAEDGEGLELALLWNPDVYAEATARSWLAGFAAWARWLAAAPAGLDSPLPALLPEEEALLDRWEHGKERPRPDRRAHELFEEIAARRPDRPAVVTRSGAQTYGALNRDADRVATALLRCGVARGEAVAVLTGCSPGLPAAVLGVWKAGAAYLPLAHDLPPERMAYMVRDAGVGLLIALDGQPVPPTLADAVPTLIRPEILEGPAERTAVAGAPDDLAYIIYTSGTTGHPKGVAVRHDGFINAALATGEMVGLHPDDRMALAATPGFDASLWELGLALLHGMALVPVPPDLRDDPWVLKDAYTELGVTVAFHAPSYLRVSQEKPFRGLRVLLTGGEAPNADDARHHAADLAFWNAYGPTEASILASMGRILPGSGRGGPVPAGRPLPNSRVTLRRPDGTPVPPGLPGEVWLGGVGLARGYLNNPDLTARAFVETAEGRFYRTGDRGRWTADGQLILCGRIDHQVKLHGQRVELAEIEQDLLAHPAAAQAVVLVAAAAEGTKALRAFVRAKDGATLPDEETWRAFLADRLPAFMVPASVTAVNSVPLTPAGKIDRDALLRLAHAHWDTTTAERQAPRDGLEQRIAALWGGLLGEKVARTDNFFALGGNSLLAVTIAHRLSQELGVAVPARTLFAAPTLAGFARKVAELRDAETPQADTDESDLATEGEREFRVAEAAGLDTRPFIIPVIRAVEGELPDEARWADAWTALAERHEALRTTFAEDTEGRLRRHIAPTIDVTPELSKQPDRAAALAHIRARQGQPFAMATAPLWRAGLVTLADGGAPLFWMAMHHSIGDGRSVGILLEELTALLAGKTLSPLPARYAAMAARERRYLESPDRATDEAHWQEQLSALPAEAFDDWPLDTPRAAGAAPGSHRFELRLEPSTAAGLKAVARRHEASLHAVLLTLLAREVRRRTGRSAVTIGTTGDIRETAEDARVVGYGVNMLPLALRPAAGLPFGVELRATQAALADALQHARLPFARICHGFWADRPQQRDPARYPLFDIAVTENPQSAPTFGPLRLVRPDGDGPAYERTGHSPGQEMVLIHEGLADGGLLLQWHVNAALYARDTAERWFEALAGWAHWLGSDAARADVSPPALLPEEETTLAVWEHGPAVERPALPFHALFERLIDRPGTGQGGRPAVIAADRVLTYRAVEAEANAIAHALRERGAERGTVVGVLTGRSPNLPAALLGVWKTGAVYLPLAADLPAERLAFMAGDAGAALLLALDGVAVPDALSALPLLRPEDLSADFRTAHAHRPQAATGPEDTAYILYTSGSTGRPKGTPVGHGAYVNMVLSAVETFGLTPEDRTLMFASPSFDVSLSDTGVPLAAGAALCAVPYEVLSAPARLIAFLAERRVTVADLTPTYLRLFDGAELPSLRILVTGGEAPLAADVRTYAGRLRYYNAYGPTENTITSAMGLLGVEDRGFLPVGRPLPNTSMHIRDAAGNPVPLGAIGEIWLGGANLARGYLNRPEQEAAAFVGTGRGRLYRSGDLGRWRANGELEVLGRVDDQVKLNGIRIELGEIEQALGSHPDVAQAVALVQGKAGSAQSLWAFVRPVAGKPAPAEESWRGWLAERLPAVMIPAGLIAVETVPVTASGKVDRAALQKLLAGHAPQGVQVPPQGRLEETVARVWAERLGRGPVWRDDNFFALGGHSLLAIAVAHTLETELGRPVSARDLFTEPTLRGFATRLAATATPADLPSDAESDRATEGQREFWVAEQAGLDTRGFNIPLTLTVEGDTPADDRWQDAWTTLAERHEALRTGFHEDEGGMLRRVVHPVTDALEIEAALDRAAALDLIRKRQTAPFAMAAPPLWRAGLVRVADDGGALFWLALHHSIGDGLSLGLLADDLAALLRGVSPPGRAPGFGRSAAKEESYLTSEAAKADVEHWQNLLAGIDPAAFEEWPLDNPRPPVRRAETAKGSHCHRVRLAPDVADALRALARRNGASLHALMMTLMAHEVRRRTGRAAFLMGTAASTRETAEEAGVVGYFINMLPVPFRMDRSEPLEQAVKATQSRLAEALRHGRQPFARIHQEFRRSQPQAHHPARYPLFDLAVTENPAMATPRGDGLRFAAIDALSGDGIQYELRQSAPAQDLVLVHEGQVDGGLVLQLYANAALYERETAQAWAAALAGWARRLADAQRTPGEPLPALLPEEETLLAAWECGPAMPHPVPCFHHRFATLARSQPDRPALVTDDGAVSYAAMNARANALAHALLAQGVRSGDAVGVLTERSPALPEAVLAIWKAGAAYLPLTRDLPADRLAFIAGDAAIRVVVALDDHPLPDALAQAGYAVLRPESLTEEFRAAHAHEPEAGERSGPGDPAYIIHTSGSTGVPKGVVLHHGGLLNLGLSMARMLGVQPDERTLLSSSPSFDAWISDCVMTWATGGALVPIRRAEMDDTAGLRAKMERLGVTSATLPPSYLRLFEQADLPTLRILMTVGEPPNTADALHYAARLRYINGYGPTENTAAASIGILSPDSPWMSAGRPLPNTAIHILDEDGEPVPPGAIGHVWLSGMGLAIGYLNQPDLTAAAFVETPKGRRYRTGDLGRWLPNGELFVLGRSDSQVKLRGQRVELGEIEHRLEAHPGVQQAVALVDTPPGGTQTLWAFVSLAPDAAEPTQAAWAAHAAAALPTYMVPAAVIRVPAIPVTVAGKVDRKALLQALADHAPSEGTASGAYTPPRNAVEQRVAELWAEQLQRPVPGREAGFFELGGDSLRAIAVVNRLRREFACRINDLYEAPVLADFALRLRPQPDHLHRVIDAVRAHWRDYLANLSAFDAARDRALAEQQQAYEARNAAYAAFDGTARRDYGEVLLTGATGYLGAYLLRELLSDPARKVTALVRGGDDGAAHARLGRVLAGYFGAAKGAALIADPRLTVRAGDLRRDGLGLTPTAHGALAEGLGAVFHCAANVNHFGHYAEFHADNVEATRRLLDLAAARRGDPADFHLISTLSVTGKAPEDGFKLVTEYDAVPKTLDENYYVRSKQEAERLVTAARGDLRNASIHRVGNVVFAAEGGPLQLNLRDNAFFRQLAAFVRLGVVPDDSHVWLCHVDRVARAVALLAGASGLANETHHVENHRRDTLADFVTSAAGMAGAVRAVGFDALLDRLERAIGEPDMDGALAQTLEGFGLYSGRSPQARGRRQELTSERTQGLLGRMGFGWPPIPRAGQADVLRAAADLFSR